MTLAVQKPASLLDLFRSGYDTNQIAKMVRLPEAVVSRRIHELRCEERGLPCETQVESWR